MSEKLIKMFRVLAPDESGASTADVHPSQVDACLATGWRLASDGKSQTVDVDESVSHSVKDAAESAASGRRKK